MNQAVGQLNVSINSTLLSHLSYIAFMSILDGDKLFSAYNETTPTPKDGKSYFCK